MSHPMQNSLRTNTSQSPVHAENADPLALAETLKIVSCPVCRAVYIPSWQQERERASLTLLEAAFLSICHFCFRCQRPACPQCWNPIHCACAACSEEAQLPFRSPVPSLEGLIFSCPAESSSTRPTPRSFTCLRNGNFYFPDPALRASASQDEEVASPAPITSAELPAIQNNAEPPASFDPPWLREALNQRQGEQAGGPAWRPTGQWANSAAIWPVQVNSLNVSPHTSGPEWGQVSRALPPMPALPALSVETRQIERQEQESDQEDEGLSLFERVENVLIIVISTLLLAIVLMLVLALSSPQMNTFFYQLIHIDIRTEILYLLQLR